MADDADPPERDTKDYRFQQLCKVRIADHPDSVPLDRGSAIQVSSKYGLTFVAMPRGFKVLRTAEFLSQDAKHSSDRLQHVIQDFPVWVDVSIGEKVTHLALSCDDLTLAVATLTTDHAFLYLYDVRNFANQISSPVSAFLKVNMASGNISLLDLAWNPGSAKLLVTCLSSGRLDMYEITDKLCMRASSDNAKAKCVCWSPKGKQLVVGREDGLLVQYDPDLAMKRKWDYPSVFPDQSYQAIDLMWLSTYTFMVAYISSGADCTDQPQLLMINGSKDGPATYTSFEDVCYGRGEERQRKYFFNFIQKWDMLVSGSSNASEVVVVGKHLDNKDAWERWNLDDACRAECPLTDSYEDTFPMGVAIDYSSQTPIPLGDDKSHPPSPVLLVLSTEGLIIPYFMVYLHKDAPALTEPLQALDTSGMRKPAAGANGSAAGMKQPTAAKNLFGNLSDQTASAAAFGTAQPSSNQALPKPVFSATSDQNSTLGGSDPSMAKPSFGTGQQPYNFAASTPKSGSGAGFSFTPSVGATTGNQATNQGFAFGQNTAAAPSFSFLPKTTASGSTDAVPSSGAGTLGSLLGSKPAEPFQFKVGAPVGTQAGQSVTNKPQQSTATTGAAPQFGTTTGAALPFGTTPGAAPPFGTTPGAAPPFGTSPGAAPPFGTTPGAAPPFGTTPGAAPPFGTTPGAAPPFGTTPGAAPPFGTTTGAAPPFGTTPGAAPPFGTSPGAAPPFGTTPGAAPPFGTTPGAAPPFGTTPGAAPPFGTTPGAAPPFGTTTGAAPPFGTTPGAAPPFGTTTATAFSAGAFGTSATGLSKGFGASTAAGSVPFGTAAVTTSSAMLAAPLTTSSSSFGGAGFPVSKPATTVPAYGFVKPGSVGTSAAVTTSDPTAGVASVTKPVTMATGATNTAPLKAAGLPDANNSRGTLGGTLHKSSTLAGLAGLGQAPTNTDPGLPPAQTVVAQPQDTRRQSPDLQETGASNTQSVDHSFSKSILDEIKHFEQELSDLKSRASKTDFTIGSSSEMSGLKKQTQDIDLYCGEIKKTMLDLNKDVQDQTAFCLDMFSSVEESRMRQQMMTDPKYHHLLKSRTLDPGSADKLQTLQHHYQKLDQGLRDVDLILDTQWEEYQNKKKNKTNRMQAPTNDAVYRVVKSNHNLLVAQKAKLGQLEERLKQLKLYNQTVTWNTSSYSGEDKTELSTLADSLVSTSPVRAPSHSSSKESSLGSNKLARLRDHLYRRHVPVVKSTRPENLSMSKIALEDSQLWRSPEKTQTEPKPSSFAAASGPDLPQGQGKPGEFVGMFRRSTPGAPVMSQTYTAATGKRSTQMPQGQNINLAGYTVSGQEASAAQGKPGFGQTSMKFKPDNTVSALGGRGFGTGDMRGLGFVDNTAPPPPQQPQMPVVVTRVKEVNGIKLEDITPSGSENEVEETEEDEYDEEEDSSSSNGQGFGPQYNLPGSSGLTGTMTGTPISSKLPAVGTGVIGRVGEGSTPVGRKLFGNDEPKPAGGFNFGVGDTSSASTFAFGATGSSNSQTEEPKITTTTTNAGKSLPFGQPPSTAASALGQFTFGQPSGTESTSGQFSFGQSATETSATGQSVGFQFGTPAVTSPDSDKAGFKFGIPSTAAATAGFTSLSITSASSVPQTMTSTVPSNLSAVSRPSQARSESPQITSSISTETKQLQSSRIIGQPSDADSSTGQPVVVVAPSVVARSTRDEDAPETSKMPFGGSQSGSAGFTGEGTSKPASIFGQPAGSAASGSIFGQVSSTTASFGLSQPAEAPKVSTTTDEAIVPSLPAPNSSSASKVATASNGDQSVPATERGSTSGSTAAASAPDGLFGQTASSSVNSGTALFGKSPASTTPSLFGSPTSSVPSGLFGTSASSGGFLGSSAASTASSALFGMTTATTASTSSGLFGTSTATAPTTSSGTPASSTAATTASGLFGTSDNTSTGTGLFGQPTSASTSGFPFGASTTSSTVSGTGLFGQPTSSGLFGQPSSGAGSPSGVSPFGQATSSAGGLFGTPSSSGVSSSPFGSTTSTAPSGLFGQKSGAGLFGTSQSGFGTATSSAGFGASTSGSGFGFGQSSSPGFAQPGFGQTPAFGQTSSAGGMFGTSVSGGEGGMLSGLGAKPSEEKANTNVFGASQAFGSATSSSGLFGAQAQGFGSTATSGSSAGPFSGGSFSAGGQGVGSTGFSALGQQSPGGFGSAPAFGSPPAFGSSPAFGSAPAFGSPPAFGAGSTTGFGSAPAFGGGTTFGSPSTSGAQSAAFAGFAAGGSPTFGALAQSTDAPSFGNLAQGGGEGGFGAGGGGGFGAGGGGGGFGSPSFGGGAGQSPSFGGGSSFGSNPSFTGYRG